MDKTALFITVSFMMGCNFHSGETLQEINAQMDAKLKIHRDYFQNIKNGDFVPLNMILKSLKFVNEKEIRTRGVLIIKGSQITISDRECPLNGEATQLRELFVKNDSIKEMPSSGTHVEISGKISIERTGLYGMWPGSISIKTIHPAKSKPEDDCSSSYGEPKNEK